MKKLLAAMSICFLTLWINNSFAQTKASVIKASSLQNATAEMKKDSAQLKQEEINAFVEQVISNTSLKDFQQWCYKTMTAEKFDDFKQVYQVFLQQKFEEWMQAKGKIKPSN